jgi:hypothetical protein
VIMYGKENEGLVRVQSFPKVDQYSRQGLLSPVTRLVFSLSFPPILSLTDTFFVYFLLLISLLTIVLTLYRSL